jgi:hypothetical protein
VTKLRDSRWESQEEEEQAEEKATMEEKEGEANEQEQAEVTGRVTRRLLPTMSSLLVIKLLDTGRVPLYTMSSRLVTKLWVSR